VAQHFSEIKPFKREHKIPFFLQSVSSETFGIIHKFPHTTAPRSPSSWQPPDVSSWAVGISALLLTAASTIGADESPGAALRAHPALCRPCPGSAGQRAPRTHAPKVCPLPASRCLPLRPRCWPDPSEKQQSHASPHPPAAGPSTLPCLQSTLGQSTLGWGNTKIQQLPAPMHFATVFTLTQQKLTPPFYSWGTVTGKKGTENSKAGL